MPDSDRVPRKEDAVRIRPRLSPAGWLTRRWLYSASCGFTPEQPFARARGGRFAGADRALDSRTGQPVTGEVQAVTVASGEAVRLREVTGRGVDNRVRLLQYVDPVCSRDMYPQLGTIREQLTGDLVGWLSEQFFAARCACIHLQ